MQRKEQELKLGGQIQGARMLGISSPERFGAMGAVAARNVFFSSSIAHRPHDQKATLAWRALGQRATRLTSRELEVLKMIAESAPTKQVAVELGISFKTAEKHRQSLMQKLNIHDVAGLTRYAIAAGIIELNLRLLSVS